MTIPAALKWDPELPQISRGTTRVVKISTGTTLPVVYLMLMTCDEILKMRQPLLKSTILQLRMYSAKYFGRSFLSSNRADGNITGSGTRLKLAEARQIMIFIAQYHRVSQLYPFYCSSIIGQRQQIDIAKYRETAVRLLAYNTQ